MRIHIIIRAVTWNSWDFLQRVNKCLWRPFKKYCNRTKLGFVWTHSDFFVVLKVSIWVPTKSLCTQICHPPPVTTHTYTHAGGCLGNSIEAVHPCNDFLLVFFWAEKLKHSFSSITSTDNKRAQRQRVSGDEWMKTKRERDWEERGGGDTYRRLRNYDRMFSNSVHLVLFTL